jgi:predicted nucleotidyltransferase
MDIERLLKLLHDRKVRYVIVGAAAFPVHGFTRATADFDIFVSADEENVRTVRQALLDFGYDVSEISLSTMQEKKLLIRQYLVEIDIHPHVKGVDFESVWENRTISTVGQTPANFASLDDLIKMKKAAGRAKDKEDLKILNRLKRRKSETKI